MAGIRQLRQANELTAYLGGAGGKRGTTPRRPGPRKDSGPVRRRVQKRVDNELDEVKDVESLAAAYLETSLQNWALTPSELNNIRVVHSDGEMSTAEKKMRQKFKK